MKKTQRYLVLAGLCLVLGWIIYYASPNTIRPIIKHSAFIILAFVLCATFALIPTAKEKKLTDPPPEPKKAKSGEWSLWRVLKWAFVIVLLWTCILLPYEGVKFVKAARLESEARRNAAGNLRMEPLPVQFTQFGNAGPKSYRGDLIQNDQQAMKFNVRYLYDAVWYQSDFTGKPAGFGPDGKANLFKGEFITERPKKSGTWTLHKHPSQPYTWTGTTEDPEGGSVSIELQLL